MVPAKSLDGFVNSAAAGTNQGPEPVEGTARAVHRTLSGPFDKLRALANTRDGLGHDFVKGLCRRHAGICGRKEERED